MGNPRAKKTSSVPLNQEGNTKTRKELIFSILKKTKEKFINKTI